MGRCSCRTQYVGVLLTPHSVGPSWEANSSSPSQEIPRFFFMEVEGSLPCAKEPFTCLVYSPRHSIVGKIHSSIILPCTRRSCEWSFFLKDPIQNRVYVPVVPHTCHMPSASHSAWFVQPNTAWCTIKSRWSSLLCGFLRYLLIPPS